MKKSLIFLLIFWAFLPVEAKTLNECFQIIPKPQQIEIKKGKGLKFGDLQYVSIPDTISMPVLGALLDGLPRVQKSGKGVTLKLTGKHVPESAEGYVLEIRPEGVAIISRGEAGLFYGCQTLEQLLEDSRDFHKEIPLMTITDYPAVPYPDYTISNAVGKVSDQIYMFDKNTTGFIGFSVKVEKPSKLFLYFDEILSNGDIDAKRLTCNNFLIYELDPGEYHLESIEPYTLKYLKPEVKEGDCEISNLYIRNYVNSDVHRAKFSSNNKDLDFLFEAARETYRQSTLDVFMDNPSRERAGWLCDSYFSARVAFDMSGNTLLEKNFFENYLLPDSFKYLPKGMLPMCYPSDHNNGNFIPNWAMWFVVQMEEYVKRSGDMEMIGRLKPKVYELIRYFASFKNSDGLLEKLDKWIFVEWSAANQFVQDVNYPTNMLYAKMLDIVGCLYNDVTLKNEAKQIRKIIREQSFDGNFFCDNAIRKDGKLEVQPNQTEVCQYYAFYFDVATPEEYPELWQCLLKEFGPIRKKNNKHPSIHMANAFIGNYLRLELLSEHHLVCQLMEESLDEYLIMAETTGTLWENMTSVASCNQGFASHIAHVFFRDILGLYEILPVQKEIKIRFNDMNVMKCEGTIPVGDDYIYMKWEKSEGILYYSLSIPKGYRIKIENFSKLKMKESLII